MKQKKKIPFTAIKIVVTALLLGVLAFLVYKEWAKIYDMFARMQVRYFVLAMALMFISMFTGFLVWQTAFLATRIHVHPLSAFRAYFLGLFYNNVLPTSIGGDVVKVIEMKEMGTPVDTTVSAILIDRVLTLYILVFSSILFTPLIIRSKTEAAQVSVIVGVFIFATVLAAIVLYNERTYAFLVRVVRRVIPWKKVTNFMCTVFESFHRLKHKRRFALLMVVCVVVTQTLRILFNYFIGLSLSLSIALPFYFVCIPLVTVATLIPISLSGYGVAELSGAFLFSKLLPGISYSQGGMLMFTAHIALLIVNLVCGFAFFIPKRERH